MCSANFVQSVVVIVCDVGSLFSFPMHIITGRVEFGDSGYVHYAMEIFDEHQVNSIDIGLRRAVSLWR